MLLPEELKCRKCKCYSLPNYIESEDCIKAYCFYCEQEIEEFEKTRMPYGKYKDKFIDDLTDVQYLEWIRDSFDCKNSRFIVNAVEERLEEIKIKQEIWLGIVKKSD